MRDCALHVIIANVALCVHVEIVPGWIFPHATCLWHYVRILSKPRSRKRQQNAEIKQVLLHFTASLNRSRCRDPANVASRTVSPFTLAQRQWAMLLPRFRVAARVWDLIPVLGSIRNYGLGRFRSLHRWTDRLPLTCTPG